MADTPLKFRLKLRDEIAAWKRDGLVDAATEEKLLARYPLSEGAASAGLLGIYVLGSLLIGGGVIAFIAWNWSAMSAPVKLGLFLSAMIGVQVAGWRMERAGQRPRLGQALSFLGTLLFGANIGLFAQVFHVSSSWYRGFAAWAVGALAAALLQRNKRAADLAVILGFVATTGYLTDGHSTWDSNLAARLLPGLLTPYAFFAIALIPALVLRARTTVVLALMLFGLSAFVGSGWVSHHDINGVSSGWITALCLSALYAMFPVSMGDDTALPWKRAGRVLALICFLIAAFALSFQQGRLFHPYGADPINMADLALLAPLGVGALLGLARIESLKGDAIAVPIIGGTILILATVLTAGESMPLTIAANVALAVLAISALAASMESLRRDQFWLGNLLGGTLIVARFLEIETELWLKAIAFAGSGIAVILVGLAFERRLKHEVPAHA